MPPKDFASKDRPAHGSSIAAGLAVLLGIAAASYGFWLAWHPLGFISAGASMSAIGVLLGRKFAHRGGVSL
jgi:hypothetical protein